MNVSLQSLVIRAFVLLTVMPIHEYAHALAHKHLENNNREYREHRNQYETEAEAISYVVSKYLNMQTNDFSLSYLYAWSKEKDFKEEFEKAYDLFGMFISAADKLYKAGIMAQDTVNVPVAAYNMSLCGMQLEDYKKVLSHVDMAMANKQMAPSAFRYKTVAVAELGDTTTWLKLCQEGTQLFPEDAYFSQSLIQYYDSRGENDKLSALADELVAANPNNPLFVYLKAYIPHQKEDYDTAIEWYNKTLEVDPDYENALANLARCYLMKANTYLQEQSSTNLNDKKKIAKDKEILNGYFNQALPLLEKLRVNCPDKTELWLTNLMNCYYNLNMSNKVKELEKLQEELGY